MKIFVTGGNGFIGSVVVRMLTAAGHQVRCLLRRESDTRRIVDLAWKGVEGDIRDPAAVRRGMQGTDAVIHMAAIASWRQIDFPKVKDVIERGTTNVLEAAQTLGRPRMVFVSSVATFGGSRAPRLFDERSDSTSKPGRFVYADAKRVAESRCLAAARGGLPVVIVNPTEVYGPQDTSLITAGNLIDFTTGPWVFVCQGGTSIVHVEDVAAGIVRALERGTPGERYILGGENLSIRELAAMTLGLFGLRHRIVSVPNALARGVGVLGLKLRMPLPFNPHVIPYATRYWYVDATKARRELGISFRPARETLSSVAGWLREAGYRGAPAGSLEPCAVGHGGPANCSRTLGVRTGALN